MKVSRSILVLALVVVAMAEPPVDYSTTQQDAFAPPSANAPSASYGVPSSSYGPPSNNRFSNRQTTAILRPSSNYGAPSSTGGRRGAATFGGHTSNFGGQSTFGGQTSSTFGGQTSSNFGGQTSNFGGHRGRTGSKRPSTSYGTPSSSYGAPSTGTGGYDGSSEPANYKFSYHVQDASSGNDYGHQESREGHVATGMYMVLLPDGRRQIVEYTADESGYHPNVRYEGTATGGGYPSATGATGGGGYRY